MKNKKSAFYDYVYKYRIANKEQIWGQKRALQSYSTQNLSKKRRRGKVSWGSVVFSAA